MLNILAWILIGLIAGYLASMIMGRGGYGVIGDIIVGLVGALIGGFLASLLFGRSLDAPLDMGSFILNIIIAMVGAIILIAIVRALSGGRTRV